MQETERKTLQAGCVESFTCEFCGDTDCEPVTIRHKWSCIGCALERGYNVTDCSGYTYFCDEPKDE